MTIIHKLKQRMKDSAGVVLIIYSLALMPVMGLVGLSIDVGSVYYSHAILTGAVDSAALAAAKVPVGDNAKVQAKAIAMFNANIPANFFGNVSAPTIMISQNGQRITVTASAEINTYFLKLLGRNTLSSIATAQVERETTGLEVVLALDNTGSMAGGNAMQGEINAANKLVDVLFGDEEIVDGLWVGVVPYTTTVNIMMLGSGFSAASWLTAASQSEINNTNLYPDINGGRWSGCIEARATPHDMTDETYTSQPFISFLYPSTMIHKYTAGQPLDRADPIINPNNANGIPPWFDRSCRRRGCTVTQVQTGDNDWRLNGSAPSGRFFGDNWFHGNNGVGPNLGCPVPMLPLTAEKTMIKTKINEMKATYRGGTMINTGLQAAWWMISPKWTGLWPVSISGQSNTELPKEYGETQKAIILMTDGENQWYDWPGGVPGAPGGTSSSLANNDADYGGYGRLAEGRIATTNSNVIQILNDRMLSMCTAIKDQDIVMYTIIFSHGGAIGQDTQDLFQACASSPDKAFFAITNEQLEDVFGQIGVSLNNLRLSWPGTT